MSRSQLPLNALRAFEAATRTGSSAKDRRNSRRVVGSSAWAGASATPMLPQSACKNLAIGLQWCFRRRVEITVLGPLEVSAGEVPIGDAIRSYLFNSQLVSPPDGTTTLVAPTECAETPSVAAWIERHLASNGAIRRVEFVDVRQSMANGGGPACLRLRVACDPETVDPRFLVDEAKLDLMAEVIARHWPPSTSTVNWLMTCTALSATCSTLRFFTRARIAGSLSRSRHCSYPPAWTQVPILSATEKT